MMQYNGIYESNFSKQIVGMQLLQIASTNSKIQQQKTAVTQAERS